MAKIREIIERVDELRPNVFSEKVKLAWISELEGKIASDVMLMSIDDVRQLEYTHPEGMESEPLVSYPHQELYVYWLQAQIDYANGEYNKYQNSMEMYNTHYGNFVRWFANTYEPAQGYPERARTSGWEDPPYYITAYGLARKGGFTGTLAEWLVSLKGEPGEPGMSGAAGKTAYEYAVDGGYEGSEEEFSKKLVDAVNATGLPDSYENFNKHLLNMKNPHGVTAEQVGAAPASHTADKNNPHGVTAAQIGAAPAGYGIGTTSVNIDSVYDITKNGLYLTNGDTPDGGWWFVDAVVTNGGANIIVNGWKLNGTKNSVIVKSNSTWGSWISMPDLLTNRGTGNGDFNEKMDVGTYWMQLASCTNGPDAEGFGVLKVSRPYAGIVCVLQTFYKYSYGKVYARQYVNGAWENWKRIDPGAVTLDSLGAAPARHDHAATEITRGTMPIARGGTGATDAVTARANIGAASLDEVYPVNSIYISYSHTSPASLFGGTWTRLSSTFLWGTGADGQIGFTGGAADVALTETQLPNLHGALQFRAISGGGNNVSVKDAGNVFTYTEDGGDTWNSATGKVDGDRTTDLITFNVGSNEAHNNMPPYTAVSIWRRIA